MTLPNKRGYKVAERRREPARSIPSLNGQRHRLFLGSARRIVYRETIVLGNIDRITPERSRTNLRRR